MSAALQYAAALLGTIGVETLLAPLFVPRAWKRLRIDVPLLNLLSHPLLTLAVWHGALSLPAAEVGVITLEALGYRFVTGLEWRTAFLLSAALNLVTWGLGLLLLLH